jgi:hypothetical protein
MLVYWRILGALPDRAKVLALGPWATMAAAWSAKIVEKQLVRKSSFGDTY